MTEIVHALDMGHLLIARNTTSTYPPEARDLPDIGYLRALSPKGVLSVRPELILAEEGSGPLETMQVLAETSIEIVRIPDSTSRTGRQTRSALWPTPLTCPSAARA